MGRLWRLHPHDESLVRSIASASKISPIVAQLLAVRGITTAAAVRQFLDAPLQDLPPGDRLPGVEQASEEICKAIRQKDKIVVYGDYDADGMTGTAILVRCIELLGGKASYYVPNRLGDGYGLNEQALTRISQQGAALVITVDCGIASVAEARLAHQLGLKLIITDHHQYGSELPSALAIVHPSLPGTTYGFPGLCGAGVALKLAWRVCQNFSEASRVPPAQRNFLMQALGLAAIATVADVVPLVDENRLIVRHGLRFLKEDPIPGIEELMRLTGLNEKPALSSEDIAFTLAPRLNAAGRLGQAQLGVELLTTHSKQRAAALADYIHQLNESRDSLEKKILKEANKRILERNLHEGAAIVLADRNWHAGVIGIVAGRLAEKYHRPTVLIAQDETGNTPGTGSARTACGINLIEALQQCDQFLVTCGGHRQAAGLRVDEDRFEGFGDAFCTYVEEHTRPEDLQPQLEIDAQVPLSQLTLKTLYDLEQLAPFGEGNRRPTFSASGVELVEPPKRIGGGERHLSLKVVQHGTRMRGVSFGNGEWAEELSKQEGPVDFAFRPMINEFRGRRSVELQIVDWRPSRTAAEVAASG